MVIALTGGESMVTTAMAPFLVTVTTGEPMDLPFKAFKASWDSVHGAGCIMGQTAVFFPPLSWGCSRRSTGMFSGASQGAGSGCCASLFSLSVRETQVAAAGADLPRAGDYLHTPGRSGWRDERQYGGRANERGALHALQNHYQPIENGGLIRPESEKRRARRQILFIWISIAQTQNWIGMD
jgi:hypothetical protein